jgi:hypothetical protein
MSFEGIVSIADMERLRVPRPEGITGRAVAGMPMGSAHLKMPGMQHNLPMVSSPSVLMDAGFARHGWRGPSACTACKD